jgi:hypothetical protein
MSQIEHDRTDSPDGVAAGDRRVKVSPRYSCACELCQQIQLLTEQLRRAERWAARWKLVATRLRAIETVVRGPRRARR